MNTVSTPSAADLRAMANEANNLAATIQAEKNIHPFTSKQTKKVEEIAKALPWHWAHNLEADCDGNDFAEGILTTGGLSVVYGPSGSGKSFVVLRLAAAIAMGHKFYDHECDKGVVIYLAAEGAQGVKNRMVALRREGIMDGDSRLVYVPCCINVLDEKQVDSLLATVKETSAGIDVPVRLVILDTLSRCIPGANENGPEDMTTVIQASDRIRELTGAHVLFVHHTGKDVAAGSRGHSSLRAATDTEIEIIRKEGEKVGLIVCRKSKDLEMFESMAFQLRQVVLDKNRRGKDVTTCVLEEVAPEDAPKLEPKKTAVDGAIGVILKALAESEDGLNATQVRRLPGGSGPKDKALAAMVDSKTIIKIESLKENRYYLPQHKIPQYDPKENKPTDEKKPTTMANPGRAKV